MNCPKCGEVVDADTPIAVRTDWMAIASPILGIFSIIIYIVFADFWFLLSILSFGACVISGLVLGIIAVSRISRNRSKGKALAIIGIIVCIIMIALLALFLFLLFSGFF